MLTGDKLASLLKRAIERKEDDRIEFGVRKNGQPVSGRDSLKYAAHVLKHLEATPNPDITTTEFGNRIKCWVLIESTCYDLSLMSWR